MSALLSPPDASVLPDTEIRPGRRSRYRFTQTPQWALLHPQLSDAGYRVYALLLAHVDHNRDDTAVWPTQQTLADMLGRHRNSLSRAIGELSALGLVDVAVVRYGPNNTRRRNVYTVHEEPPEGWEGSASLQEWRQRRSVPPPPPASTDPGRTKNGASGRTKNGAEIYTQKNNKIQHAPSARSAAPVRRTAEDRNARAKPRQAAAAACGRRRESALRAEHHNPALDTVTAPIRPLLERLTPSQQAKARSMLLTVLSTGMPPDELAAHLQARYALYSTTCPGEPGYLLQPFGWLVSQLPDVARCGCGRTVHASPAATRVRCERCADTTDPVAACAALAERLARDAGKRPCAAA